MIEDKASSSQPRLQDLIPLAVVIAAGCEPCAKRMVEKALNAGSPAPQIRKTVEIVGHLSRQRCFADAVGDDAVARFAKPLAMARATLDGFAPSTVASGAREAS